MGRRSARAITDEQREALKRWVRAQRTPQTLVLRARIVLMAADGLLGLVSYVPRSVGDGLRWRWIRLGGVYIRAAERRSGAMSDVGRRTSGPG